MSYTNDGIACGSDFYAFEEWTATGNDARLLSFSPSSNEGGHREPDYSYAWLVGCLGMTDSCSTECEASFSSCVITQGYSFADCLAIGRFSSLDGCTNTCALTLGMLEHSESPVVSLSNDMFGTVMNISRPKTRPNCAFGPFEDGVGNQNGCYPPSPTPTTTGVPEESAASSSGDEGIYIAVGVAMGGLVVMIACACCWFWNRSKK